MTINEFEAKAFEMAKKCGECVLSSITEEGYPRSCMLSMLNPENYYTMYFSTGLDGVKTRQFRKNSKASVCYVVGNDSVTLVGDVDFVTDIETKKKCWSDWMFEYFPGGPATEEFCVLRFVGKEATFWIEHEFLRDEPVKK